jgi:hypothetical protein
MKTLDQELRDYYASQSLSADRVEHILAAAKIVRPPLWRQPAWIALAAGFMLLLTAVAVLVQRTPPGITDLVAAEVARNHNKHLEPEVQAVDFAAIQKALPRLDFSIAPTRPDLLAGLTVRGGRYCSVQGQLAAQIALRDGEGSPCTLYVVPLTDTLARVKPGVVTASGAQIQLWRDAHRLYVLAR